MYLNEGFLLKERYEIIKQSDFCGSTVIYLAKDKQTEETIFLKEFFPSSIMRRNEDMSLSASPGCDVQYKSLSSDYFELCSYVMSIKDMGGLIAPFDVFMENGTCYSAENLKDSETFADYLARNDGILGWQQLKKAILPLISAMRKIHSDGFYHRGISLDTIVINRYGEMLLTGFDIPAARTYGSEISSTLFFGYSAPEQYSSASWQGSWTDVYSLAAICYRALTGVTPVEWRQRAKNRALKPPASIVETIPENVSNTLLTALSVDIRNRYRTIEDFWIGLLHGVGDTTIVVNSPNMKGSIKPEISNVRMQVKSNKSAIFFIVSAILLFITVLSCFVITFILDRYMGEPIVEPTSSVSEESESEQPEDTIKTIEVPSFSGMSVEQVMQDKTYTALFNFEVKRAYSELQPVGMVISQFPLAQTQFKETGHVITLTISMGSERTTMPPVEGLPLDQAAAMLNGLNINYEVNEMSDINYEDGSIIKSSIEADEIIFRTRETVILTVARNTPEIDSSEPPIERDPATYFSVDGSNDIVHQYP